MPSFAETEIGLSQSDSRKQVATEGTWIVGSAKYDTWDDGFGDKLTYDKNDNGYHFEKKYLRVTLLVDCDYGEFVSPQLEYFKINGETIFAPGVNGYTWGRDVLGSRHQKIAGIIMDPRVLIHVNVPTKYIYNKTIKNISCKMKYGLDGSKTEDEYWDLTGTEWQVKVHQGYYWKKDGSYWYLYNYENGSTPNYYFLTSPEHEIKPQNYYSANVSLSSLQRDGTYNPDFFTRDKGQVKIKFELGKYLSEDSNRIPYAIKFKGSKANQQNITPIETEPIYLTPKVTGDTIYEKTINSNKFSDFMQISEAWVQFDSNQNYVKVQQFSGLYYDSISYLTDFTIKQSNNNTINKFVSMTENDVTLQTYVECSITPPKNCPYIFKNSAKGQIIKKDATKGVDIDFSANYSQKDPVIKAILNKEYTCTASGDLLQFPDDKLEPNTEYFLSCPVINNLKSHESATEQDYSLYWKLNYYSPFYFKINNEDLLYAALGNPGEKIKYYYNNNEYIEIPGDIINPGEGLLFERGNFSVFNLNTGSKENINTFAIINGKTGIQINTNTYYRHSDLLSTLQLTELDNSIVINISYKFKKENNFLENVKCNTTSSYILGRVTNSPDKDILKTKGHEIRYYLNDNGGDKKIENNGRVYSINQLIERRKDNLSYFSLSRKPQENNNLFAQERVKVELFNQGDTTPKYSHIFYFTKSNIDITAFKVLIDLLKENKTSTLSMLDILPNIDEQTLLSFLSDGKSKKIIISLEYMYKYDATNENNIVANQIFNVVLENQSFLHTIEPIGLREKGVIINPNKNEDIIETETETAEKLRANTFIINVKDVMVEETEGSKAYTPINGCRIVFDIGKEGTKNPIFEIFLDSDGQIGFSNGTQIVKPFS